MKDWRDSGHQAPEGFRPNTTRVVSDQLTLFAGWLEPVDDPFAVVFSVTPDGVKTLFEEPGKIISMDVAAPQVVWALWGDIKEKGDGSDFAVFRSIDGGASWNEGFFLEARSATQILAVSAQEAWVLGSETLLRTIDGGVSWKEVYAPGVRDSVQDSLTLNAKAVLILTKDAILATSDGEQWEEIEVENSHVCAVHGGAFLVRRFGEIQLGTRRNEEIHWLGTFGHDAKPFRLVAEGRSLRFLAVPSYPDDNPGVFYFATEDAGQNWDVRLLPSRVIEGSADLRAEGGATVDYQGKIYLL